MSPANGADARQRAARSPVPMGPGSLPGHGPARGTVPTGAVGRPVREWLATTARHTAPPKAGAGGEHTLANRHDAPQVALRAPTRSGTCAITRAIDHARRHVQHNGHARIRVVPTGPERTTWYECRTHGCVGTVVRDGRRHCARCGAEMIRHERVRADIAAAEDRARRRRSWHQRRQPRRERSAPTGEPTDRGRPVAVRPSTGEPPNERNTRRTAMEHEPRSTSQSPWPACADCQVDVPNAANNTSVREGTQPSREETCDDIPLAQDFGPWAAEVRRRAAASLTCAMARAHDDMTNKDTSEKCSTEPRRA